MPKLSIIIPAFNEAATLGELLRRIEEARLPAGWDTEVIVVNDGSTDEIEAVVEPFRRRQRESFALKYLAQPKNRGKGASVRLGLSSATGDAVVIQDADLEYDPQDYCKMLDALERDRADVVYGSRFLAAKRVTKPLHRFVNWVLTAYANAWTGLRLTDVHTCLKLFRTELLRHIPLEEDRFGFCPEITAKLAREPNIRLIEVPVSYHPRTRRFGKKVGVRDGLRALYCTVKYTLRPLRNS